MILLGSTEVYPHVRYATLGLCNPLHSSIKYIVCAVRPFTYPDGYPINPKTIGEHLRKKRMDNRLMQSDVANIIGVSEESIWNWEQGRTKPSKKNLEIINAFCYEMYNANT